MNNEEKILGLLEKIYIDLHDTKKDLQSTNKNLQETNESLRSEMQKGFEAVNLEFQKINHELQEVKNAVVRIENDNGQKLAALFDGYKQNSDKLDRIEVEVAKHEEIILRRVR